MHQSQNWLLTVLSLVFLGTQTDTALAINTTFVVDEELSSLTIDATTVFGLEFTDSDTQTLSGSVDASLDFGTSGSFPAMADLVVNGAAISPLNPFMFTLGAPPALGVHVSVNDIVADIQTPSPPVLLSLLPTALVRYGFDASGFDIVLDQGNMVATGAVNQTVDLADSPVIGAADPGTLGELTFLNINTVGPITQLDVLLELPIVFSEDVDVDGQIVTLDVTGQVVANASFNLALSGLPGDFDEDVDVDGDDLTKWRSDHGSTGSDANADGDSDGDDFLIWQRQFGIGVTPLASLQAVPEPASMALIVLAIAAYSLRGTDETGRLTK